MKRSFTEQLEELLGAAGWLTAPSAEKYTTDWLKLTQANPIGVARPASSEDISAVIALCLEHNVHVVPQGGNTGLVLGSVPTPSQPNSIVLSMERFNLIEKIDEVACTVTVQAGTVLDQLQAALNNVGLSLPVHLGSGGSAHIGGLISTNAGGSHAHRDGMMGDRVLGLEVVLPTGEIWSGNRALIKDNAGYDLKRLFCGAEGTLGVITRATLQLQPVSKQNTTLLLACNELDDALKILASARSLAGPLLSAAEFMHRTGVRILTKQCPHIKYPIGPVPTYSLLLEFASPSELLELNPIVDRLLENAMEKEWAIDGVVATSETQRKELWKIREEMPEGQRLLGAQLKHDVSVPVTSLPDYIKTATLACQSVMPSVVINPYGHLADGNVHFNLSAPNNGGAEFQALHSQLNAAVYNAVEQFNGSIAAEHGLGRSKVSLADRTRSTTERLLMKTIKQALDPNNIMNRGVIIGSSDVVPEVWDEKGTT